VIPAFGEPRFTWDIARDITQLFDYPFMVNAFWAGTIVAVVAALIGWFMVLRGQAFAGHTLALVGFPGAAGATLIGVGATYGYFTFCIAAALVIAAIPYRAGRAYSEGSAVTGLTQAFALACGFLFVSLYAGNLNAVTAFLFGSFLGITRGQVVTLGVGAIVALAALATMARSLFFSSIDADVARARGVPVGWLSVAFLVLLGLAAAEVSQITGALLVFALLVLPPATAQAVTARPLVSILLSVMIGIAVTWSGLVAAYYSPYPIGFWVTTFAFGLYVIAQIGRVGVQLPVFGRVAA
jgi:zinc/manganese transport system permease protein